VRCEESDNTPYPSKKIEVRNVRLNTERTRPSSPATIDYRGRIVKKFEFGIAYLLVRQLTLLNKLLKIFTKYSRKFLTTKVRVTNYNLFDPTGVNLPKSNIPKSANNFKELAMVPKTRKIAKQIILVLKLT
jgi:hypothetical protein